ncbi:MAG: hypothetical protein JW818_09120 [Pirellulales bacterium]|nr:hypothetical protein [Pirellulales bacterium]
MPDTTSLLLAHGEIVLLLDGFLKSAVLTIVLTVMAVVNGAIAIGLALIIAWRYGRDKPIKKRILLGVIAAVVGFVLLWILEVGGLILIGLSQAPR